MIKYAKILNEKTGICEVGTGTNSEFYKSLGMHQLDVKQSDIDNNWYLSELCPMKSEEEKLEKRKQQFQNDFFLTSLGYIRRKVTMKNGEIKDFLSDLLPVISIGVSSQQTINIITYSQPDFMSDTVDWTILQSVKPATPEFVQECFLRLNDDFNG